MVASDNPHQVLAKDFTGTWRELARVRGWNPDDTKANIRLFVAAPDLLAAAKALERAETIHANCDECEPENAPESCDKCFPYFDDARRRRRAAINLAQGT